MNSTRFLLFVFHFISFYLAYHHARRVFTIDNTSMVIYIIYIKKQTSKIKLRDFESASELYWLSDRRWSANFSANFCG
jgi:hypothetical protein